MCACVPFVCLHCWPIWCARDINVNFVNCSIMMISGELEVASAKNVVLYTTLTNKRRNPDDGIIGLLVVTNFKLSYLACNNDQVRVEMHLQFLPFARLIFYSFQSISAEYHVPREFVSQLQRCDATKYRLHIPNCRSKETINKSVFKNQCKIGRFADRVQGKWIASVSN